MTRNDDFFFPRNTDTSVPCANDSSITDGNIILPLGAALSVICYLYLMWMYFVLQSPLFKRHPTTLAVYKCMLELIFIQMYLWMPFIPSQEFYDDDNTYAPYKCSSTANSALLAFVTQFSLVGSELCFFIISYDLRIAYTNPFASFKENRSFYFALVVGISMVTSFILMMLGPRVYGMSELGLVWIQERREKGSPNYAKAVLYYVITVWVFIYSLWANLQYNRDGEKGFSKTVSNRISIMHRSRKFAVGYVFYGSMVFLMEFISFATKSRSTAIGNAPAYLLAFRGVWGLGVILYSNYSDLTWDLLNPFHLGQQQERMKEDIAMEKLLLQPHLNTALRAEILYFTTQGIMFAARDYGRGAAERLMRRQNSIDRLAAGTGSPTRTGGPEVENTEFAMNQASDANTRSYLGGGKNLQRSERSYSTAPVPVNSPFSMSALYNNRRSMPNRPGAAAGVMHSPSADYSDNGDVEVDMGGLDMFNRQSIAMFERYNKEQGDAVNKEMEVAFEDETIALGLTRRNKNTPIREIADRNSMSIAPSNRAFNLFNTHNPLQRPPSAPAASPTGAGIGPARRQVSENHHGVELQPTSMISTPTRSEQHHQQHQEQEEDDPMDRESEAGDVEFGMNQHKAPPSNRASSRIPLWRRIEAPTPELNRTLSQASDASSRSQSADQNSNDGSRSSIMSRVLLSALHTASDAAKSFFSSTQFKEFRFKDFCPKLFGKVRELSGIDNEEYAKSFEKTCKEKFSEGRSGAFMFFSSNERCIVKTTTKSESLALHGIMPQYVEHLKKNPNSLVCRFLGAHCITMYGNELYFVVMLNVFPTFPLSERYDLKGSWVNRHGFEFSRKSKRERMRRVPTDASPLYQDNDLQRKLYLELDVTNALAGQIRRDVMFLRGMSLMDYSLLIGVRRERFTVLDNNSASETSTPRGADRSSVMRDTELSVFGENGSIASRPMSSIVARPNGLVDTTVPQDAFRRDLDGGMRARLVEGPGTYYIGIIDVLQEWNFAKKMERFLKIHFKRNDADGISAIEPNAYSERFWRGAVLDTFDGLEYDTEELLSWRGDAEGDGGEDPEYLPA